MDNGLGQPSLVPIAHVNRPRNMDALHNRTFHVSLLDEHLRSISGGSWRDWSAAVTTAFRSEGVSSSGFSAQRCLEGCDADVPVGRVGVASATACHLRGFILPVFAQVTNTTT
jgi:hypothetical protein